MKKTKLCGAGFDLIGDIHGYAAPLRQLLDRLGYREIDGSFRHPNRQVIFLGDFIDRGPAIRETLQIVRSMINQGAALAVMGNHELNALCYHTLGRDGSPLRVHSEKNREQHQATLDAFADFPDEWRDYLAWFQRLPLYLEIAGFRVVHAAWDDARIAALQGNDRLDDAMLHSAACRGSREHDAVEFLLKGREIELPNGYRYADKEGFSRKGIRTKWWLSGEGRTYRDLAFPHSEDIPAIPVPSDQVQMLTGYADQAPPVFVGHYWLPPDHPKSPVSRNIACLDYSIAKGGSLVAYRWNGEGRLMDDGFVTSE